MKTLCAFLAGFMLAGALVISDIAGPQGSPVVHWVGAAGFSLAALVFAARDA